MAASVVCWKCKDCPNIVGLFREWHDGEAMLADDAMRRDVGVTCPDHKVS